MSSFIGRYVIGGTSPDDSDADDISNYNLATATITELEMELQAAERQRVADRRAHNASSNNNISNHDLHEGDSNSDDDDTTPHLDGDEVFQPTERGRLFPTTLPIRGKGTGGRSRASSGVSSSAPEMRTCQGTPIASFTSTPRGPAVAQDERQYSIPSSYINEEGGRSRSPDTPHYHLRHTDNDNNESPTSTSQPAENHDEECHHVGRERPSQFTLQDGGSDMYPQERDDEAPSASRGNGDYEGAGSEEEDSDDPDGAARIQAMLQQLRDAMAEVEGSTDKDEDAEGRASNEGNTPRPTIHYNDSVNNSGSVGEDNESPPHEARTPSASQTPRRSISVASSSTLNLGSEGRRSSVSRSPLNTDTIKRVATPRSTSVASDTGAVDSDMRVAEVAAASRSPSASFRRSNSSAGSLTNGSLSLPNVATPSDIAASPAPSDVEVPRRLSTSVRPDDDTTTTSAITDTVGVAFASSIAGAGDAEDEAAGTQTYHDGLPQPTPTIFAEDTTNNNNNTSSLHTGDLDAVVSSTADILLRLSAISPTHHQDASTPLPNCPEDADIVSTTADLLLRLGGYAPHLESSSDGADDEVSGDAATQEHQQQQLLDTPNADRELAALMAKYGLESTAASKRSPTISAAAAASRSVSQTSRASHPDANSGVRHSLSTTAVSDPATSEETDGEEFEVAASTFQIPQSMAADDGNVNNDNSCGVQSTVVSGRASLETSFTKMTPGGRSRSEHHSVATSTVMTASQPISRQLSATSAEQKQPIEQGTTREDEEAVPANSNMPRSGTVQSNTSIASSQPSDNNYANISVDEPGIMEEQPAAVRMSLEAADSESLFPQRELGLSQRSYDSPISASPYVPPTTTSNTDAPTPAPQRVRRISAPTNSSIHQFLPSATTPLRRASQAISEGVEVSRDLESYLNDRTSAPVGIGHVDISQISAIVPSSSPVTDVKSSTPTGGHPSYAYSPTIPSSNVSNQRVEIHRPVTSNFGIQAPPSGSMDGQYSTVTSRGEEEARRLITQAGDAPSRSYLEKSLSLLDTLPTANPKTYIHPTLRAGSSSPRGFVTGGGRIGQSSGGYIPYPPPSSTSPAVIEADISPVYGGGSSQGRYHGHTYTSPSRGDSNALLMNVRVPRATSQTHTSMYSSLGVDIGPWDGNNIRHLPPGDTSSHVGGGRNIYGYPSGTQHISNPVQYLVYEQKRRALLAQHDPQHQEEATPVIAEIDEASHYLAAMRAALRSKEDGSCSHSDLLPNTYQSPTSPLVPTSTPAQAAAAARFNVTSTPSRVDKAEGSSWCKATNPPGTVEASLIRSTSSPQAVQPAAQRPTHTPVLTTSVGTQNVPPHQQPLGVSQHELMRQEALDRIHTFRTHQGMATPHSNHRPQNTLTTAGLNDEPSSHKQNGSVVVDATNHPDDAYFSRMMAASYERLASPKCLQRDIPTAGVASPNNVEDSTRLMEKLHTGAAIEGHYGPGQRSIVRAAATLPSAAEQQKAAARLEARQRVESMANDPVVRRIAEEMRLEDESRILAPPELLSATTPMRTVPQNNHTPTTVSSEIKSLPRRPGTATSITSTPRHTQRRLLAPSPPRGMEEDSSRYYSPPAGLVNSVAVTHYSTGRNAQHPPTHSLSSTSVAAPQTSHPYYHETSSNEIEEAGSGSYVDVWSDSFKMKWRSTSEHYKRMLGTLPEHNRLRGPSDTFTSHTTPMSMRVGGGGGDKRLDGISMTSPHAYGKDTPSGLTPEGYMTVAYRNALTDAYASSNTHTHYYPPPTPREDHTTNSGLVDEISYITKMRELTAYRSSMGDGAFSNGAS